MERGEKRCGKREDFQGDPVKIVDGSGGRYSHRASLCASETVEKILGPSD